MAKYDSIKAAAKECDVNNPAFRITLVWLLLLKAQRNTERMAMCNCLEKMVKEGTVERVGRGRFQLVSKDNVDARGPKVKCGTSEGGRP